MLDAVIRFSVHNKLAIGLMLLAWVAWGTHALTQLPIDAVPDITNNQVQVITRAPSQAAEDIERLVTFPLEQAMATIPGISEIRSFSRFGISVITVVFHDDIDVYWARQQLFERLAAAKESIPAGIGTPELSPVTTGLGEVYQYTLHALPGHEDRYTPMELRTLQDWLVRRQLLGIEGVADVSGFGGFLKQYEVALRPERLLALGISIPEVVEALERNNQNAGGAYIDQRPFAYFIRTEGLARTLDDLGAICVREGAEGAMPVLLRDVATLRMGHAVRYGALTRNAGGEAVGGIVMMLKGANAAQVIARVKERVEQIRRTLPEGVEISPYLDRTKLVDKAIRTVATNLAEGALIVVFVLVLLLGNLRAGLIVASVIPLAMLFAVSLMNLFGVSGNLMSLGAIDFGIIVDGAVIIVEATLHHLGIRQRAQALSRQEMDEEVLAAAGQIRSSAAFGEIIILIVYLPIMALSGVEGKMFKPMAQTVAFAILGAFLLSLTYVPMMCAWLLHRGPKQGPGLSDRLMAALGRRYAALLGVALRFRHAVTAAGMAGLAASLWLFAQLGAEFIPSLDEGDFAVEVRLLTGSSISSTVEASRKAAKALLEHFPEAVEVVGKIGTSEIPTDPMPIEACDMMVILKDRSEWTSAADKDALAEKMQEVLEQEVPGVNFGFQQPIQMRFNELMSGAKQDVVLKVYGEDLDLLAGYAKQLGRVAGAVPGARDVYVEQATGLTQLVVVPNRRQLARFGLDVATVNDLVSSAFAGKVAGQVFEGEKRFDLVVRLEEGSRNSLEGLRSLPVPLPGGGQVPLSQVASVGFRQGANQIQRDRAQRRVLVGFNVRGRDIESVVEDVRRRVEREVRLAPGYYITYGGSFENLQAARERLSVAVPAALLLILSLLYFTFHSMKYSLLIFTAIPMSAIGGVLALWMRGMPFSISAGVGFIALFGVAVLNGIVLVAAFNRLRREGLGIREAILHGSAERLRPVLMTAAVASLGFLPMALSGSEGAEVQRPLATVVIGGLASATLLTLFILPCLYWFAEHGWGNRKRRMGMGAAMLLLLAQMPALGQQQALTEGQALERALANHAGLQAQAQAQAAAQAAVGTAIDLPKADLHLQRGQYNTVETRDNALVISQTIPFPTQFRHRKAWLQGEAALAGHALEAQRLDVAFEVRALYQEAALLKAQQEWWARQDSLQEQYALRMQARADKGDALPLEATSAAMAHREAELRLHQLELAWQDCQFKLMALLSDTARVGLAAEAIGLLDEPNLPAMQEQVGQHPAWLAATAQSNQAGLSRRLARQAWLPDLTFGYMNQSLIGEQEVNGVPKYFGISERFHGVEMGLTIPLWPAAIKAEAKSKALEEAAARQQERQTATGLRSQWLQEVNQYEQWQAQLAYYREYALPQARLITQQAQQALEQGELDYGSYLQHRMQAREIELAYLDAVYGHNLAVLRLRKLAGSLF